MKYIVAGSEGLLGLPIKHHLAQQGHEVLCLDLSLGHDLTDEQFVKDWFKNNPADGLVNLFALDDPVKQGRQSVSFMDVDLADFDKVLQVNVTAQLSVCREFIRGNDKGAIVNFSSIYGVVSPKRIYGKNDKAIAYPVSKSAVVQLTRYLAVHAAPTFRVNCIVPGGVANEQSADFKSAYSSHSPIGRMMEPDECSGLVSFLLSAQSSYCTGGIYYADGGWTAW